MPLQSTAHQPEAQQNDPSPAADPLAGMLQRVWLRARRRKAWLDSLNKTDEQRHADFFNDPDSWDAELDWQNSPEAIPWKNAIATADRWLESEQALPLRRLRAIFQLSEDESEALQLAAAMRIDPTLCPVFGYLQGSSQHSYLTNPLAARLFGSTGRFLWSPSGNLAVWRLVVAQETERGEAEPLVGDPILPHWLSGEIVPDAKLTKCLRRPAKLRETDRACVEKLARLIERSLESERISRLIVTGPPQSGRADLAFAAAREAGLMAVMVDVDVIDDECWPTECLLLHRFALWSGFVLIWKGAKLTRPWPSHLGLHPVQIILSDIDQSVAAHRASIDHRIDAPCLTLAEKTAAWERHCEAFSAWDAQDRERLIGNYQLSARQIAAIGAQSPEQAEDAIALAKEATRKHLGDLGSLIECPFRWDDLIVKETMLNSLKDLAYEAQARSAFWENPEARRLFPRGKSLTAIFTGNPGTGKTMAAQIIAAELKLDLYRVDLARVVSKYIGETAKHLREIFTQAARMSAILLFDEADALFSKRTDVKDSHDRYANADTGYLLQLLEDYRGLAILTTNKRGNIDTAFFRRIRYVFDFPKPAAEERRLIWVRILASLADAETAEQLGSAITVLANEIEISAAQIKNALLASIFAAKRHCEPLASPHLIIGLDRELIKDGRSVPQHVKQALL